MRTFPKEVEIESLEQARLKATQIAGMAWAEAKVCREYLSYLTELQIKPLVASMKELRKEIKYLEGTVSSISEKLTSVGRVENFNNKLTSALNALEVIIEGKLKTYKEKE